MPYIPSQSDLSLAGQVAVVTGGGTGIGRAIALEFARAGADVAIAGRRQSVLDQTVAEILETGRRAVGITTDVQQKNSVDDLAQIVSAELGDAHILVNNAANGGSGPSLLDSDESRWDEIIDTNLKSVYLACRAFAPAMLEHQRGSIINVSSIASLRPDGCRIYGIAKTGVNFLTRGLAQDMAPHVRVNCIAPGTVRTDMLTVDIGEDEQNWARLAQYVPLKRVADPVDIGTVALFLASNAANYVTGQTLAVDGGMFL